MALIRCARNYKDIIMINNHRVLMHLLRGKSQNVGKDDIDDKPAKFVESKAANWKAKYSRSGRPSTQESTQESRPWYQPVVVSLSMGVFLLYFCVFREENDIDIELGKTLYDRIEGLEEVQLRSSLQYNLEHGLDTKAIEARLQEIERERETSVG